MLQCGCHKYLEFKESDLASIIIYVWTSWWIFGMTILSNVRQMLKATAARHYTRCN